MSSVAYNSFNFINFILYFAYLVIYRFCVFIRQKTWWLRKVLLNMVLTAFLFDFNAVLLSTLNNNCQLPLPSVASVLNNSPWKLTEKPTIEYNSLLCLVSLYSIRQFESYAFRHFPGIAPRHCSVSCTSGPKRLQLLGDGQTSSKFANNLLFAHPLHLSFS